MRQRLIEGDAAVALLLVLDGERELLAEGDVVLGALGHRGIGELLRRRARSARAPAGSWARSAAASSSTRPSDSSPERSCWSGVDLARELVAPGAEHVGPGLDRVLPGAGAVDRELARPAHAAQMGVDPAQLGLVPLLLAGAAVADHGADAARGRRGTRRPRRRRRPRRTVWRGSGRRQPPAPGYWMTIRRGACCAASAAGGGGVDAGRASVSVVRMLTRLEGIHPTPSGKPPLVKRS